MLSTLLDIAFFAAAAVAMAAAAIPKTHRRAVPETVFLAAASAGVLFGAAVALRELFGDEPLRGVVMVACAAASGAITMRHARRGGARP